eukprot:124837-Chlamydomonas_euryale.AAC.1
MPHIATMHMRHSPLFSDMGRPAGSQPNPEPAPLSTPFHYGAPVPQLLGLQHPKATLPDAMHNLKTHRFAHQQHQGS